MVFHYTPQASFESEIFPASTFNPSSSGATGIKLSHRTRCVGRNIVHDSLLAPSRIIHLWTSEAVQIWNWGCGLISLSSCFSLERWGHVSPLTLEAPNSWSSPGEQDTIHGFTGSAMAVWFIRVSRIDMEMWLSQHPSDMNWEWWLKASMVVLSWVTNAMVF